MMYPQIYDIAMKTVMHCESRNPFAIASELGVKVRYCDDFKHLKGMYSIIKRNRYIVINANLSKHVKRVICAHELGHDALHRDLARNTALQEFVLYDMKSRPEYEANIFAAHILIDEEQILEYVSMGDFDVYRVASELCTDINLLLMKLHDMNRRGYSFNLPYSPSGNFLGKNF